MATEYDQREWETFWLMASSPTVTKSWVTKWVTTRIGARKRPPFLAFLGDKPAPKR